MQTTFKVLRVTHQVLRSITKASSATFKPKLVGGPSSAPRIILDGGNTVRIFLSEQFCSRMQSVELSSSHFKKFRNKVEILNIHNCRCLKFATICENSVRNLQCLLENFKFLFHPFFNILWRRWGQVSDLYFFLFFFLYPLSSFLLSSLFSGLSFHAFKASSEMSPPEKFWKFDIAAGDFIEYRIMLPTRLMTIMRKYFNVL